jgi:amidase
MTPEELAFTGAARQAELIREKQISPRELVQVYLDRIARVDDELNAFRTVTGERALAEAEQAEARLAAGDERPLLGVPVAIKDGQDVVGEVTTHGTGAYGAPARADAEIVKRLRAAGAIVIGKTLLPELAMFGFTESATWGVTRNPWNPDRTPGGSSGGSAAAVAAGLVGVASASDGAGSIRIPAASCGLFGLKPQRGRVSLAPDDDHWYGLSVGGCLARRVLDTALFLDVVSGGAADADTPPPAASFVDAARTRPERLRIAVSTRPIIPVRLDDPVRRAVHETAELLRSLGHQVRERDPDYGTVGNVLMPRYLRGIHADAARMPKRHRLERRTRAMARLGASVSEKVVAKARAAEPRHATRINSIFDDHDVLLTPVTARLPVGIGRWEGQGALRTLLGHASTYPFTGVWNVTGQPAASVLAGFSDDGMPLAVQIVARPNDEATLISLAAEIESERPWAEKIPDFA